MDSCTPLGGARRCQIGGLLALLLALPACQTNRPDPDAEGVIAQSLLMGEPVMFRVDGGPLDEPAPDTAGGTLTFAQATRQAVMTDPGMQAALARVRIAMADADQSRLLPNPVLYMVLRWGPGQPQFEVSLAQEIIQVFQIPRRSSAADNRLRQVAADAVTVALDVVADVQERYAVVQTAGRLVPVLQNRRDLVRRLAEVAKSRLDWGEGIRGDVTTLNAQRVELEIMLDEAEHGERSERLRLARLIGEPSGTATWKLDAWQAPDATPMDEQAWIDAALMHRPEVQSIAWHLAALGDDYALAALLPWRGASIGADIVRDVNQNVGPSLSTPIPIFDMGQAHLARVTAEQVEARHAMTMAKRKVVENVRLAHLGLAESIVHLARIRNELIPLVQQRREQAEQAYRAGQADVTGLFLAEQELLATQSLALEFELESSVALIRLQRAVGGVGVAATVGAPSAPTPRATTPSADEPEPRNTSTARK
jgi:outer membrane protein TolC